MSQATDDEVALVALADDYEMDLDGGDLARPSAGASGSRFRPDKLQPLAHTSFFDAFAMDPFDESDMELK